MDSAGAVRQAVILASGYGRRMRRAAPFPSKPMTPVGQKPLISYILDLLLDAGIETIFIVHHAATADVLQLAGAGGPCAGRLVFIEEAVQKGTLLTFSRVKERLTPPFLMAFEDVIAQTEDFRSMLAHAEVFRRDEVDLLIQTVRAPSVLSEKAFLTENGRVVAYQKNGFLAPVAPTQEKKYGGMVYLWLTDPFPLVERHLAQRQYKLSLFLEQYIPTHQTFEMPIRDMWDVDTPEAVRLSEEILKKRGGQNGGIERR